jgi:transposase InsO family protein
VTDAWSRKIMGYELSLEIKALDVVKALKQAVSNREYDLALLHHSDRGSQYCSALYQQALGQHRIQPFMTDGYDCYQNALAERVNGILKQEFTMAELQVLVSESIAIYNSMRPHLSLGYKTPEVVHRQQKASCETQLA